MAIFGGGGRMNAYGEPLVDSTVGEALGGLLGRGAVAVGKGIKDRLYDDEGLFRASPEGPDRFIMGKKKGIDKPFLGKKPGLDKPFLGEKAGFDKPYLSNLLGGIGQAGSRLRTMLAGNKEPDAFTEAGGGTFNTELPAKRKGLFNKEERVAYNPQEAMSMLKKGLNIQDVSQEDLGSLQQLMKDEGYYEGEVDAILGPKTTNAFNQMMQERGLVANEVETAPYRFTGGSPGRMY